MKINAGEIRVGMLLEYKNDIWQVLKTQHVKPGKGGAFAQVEMKSINKNTKFIITYSYGRALQQSALGIWSKNIKDIKATQNTFNHRAKMCSLAAQGKWSNELENK